MVFEFREGTNSSYFVEYVEDAVSASARCPIAVSTTRIMAGDSLGPGLQKTGRNAEIWNDVRVIFALVLAVAFGGLGLLLASPVFDAAATDICASYGQERGMTLTEARGTPDMGREGVHLAGTLPHYSCEFVGYGGMVVVNEGDDLIEPTWSYRGLRLAGWAVIVMPLLGAVAISGGLGLMERD